MTTNNSSDNLFAYNVDEARDLRSTFMFAGGLVLGMAALILAAGDDVVALNIPPTQLTVVAFAALSITMGGLFALEKKLSPRAIAWVALILYTIILSLAVHYSGGPQTPFPAIYLVIVLGASFLLGQGGATVIAILSCVCYGIVLYLEYTGTLRTIEIWGITFLAELKGPLLVVNWITLSIPTLVTSQLAGTLAARLKSANLHLQESERLRQNLSDMIIHDLRNPITVMMGVVDVLRMTMTDNVTSEQKELLNNASHSGHIMIELVNELLDISKMEADKFSFKLNPASICEILEENAAAVKALTDLEGQVVQVIPCPDVEQVVCDRQLITRVVANLLSNAIKNTPSGGEIRLSAELQDSEVIISVADTGIGIPKEYQQKIFEKFGQVEHPGGIRRGTGLGLTFCQMVVEAHGGRIWVESEPDKGSAFRFSLPLQQRSTIQ